MEFGNKVLHPNSEYWGTTAPIRMSEDLASFEVDARPWDLPPFENLKTTISTALAVGNVGAISAILFAESANVKERIKDDALAVFRSFDSFVDKFSLSVGKVGL